jgi:hypothetical protein
MSKSRQNIYSDIYFTIANKMTINQLIQMILNSHKIASIMISKDAQVHVWKPIFELAFPNQQKNIDETYTDAIARCYSTALNAIARNPNNFANQSEFLKNDEGFVKAAIDRASEYANKLRFYSPLLPIHLIIANSGDSVRNNKTLVKYALKGVKWLSLNSRQVESIFESLGEKLKTDTDFFVNKFKSDLDVVNSHSQITTSP